MRVPTHQKGSQPGRAGSNGVAAMRCLPQLPRAEETQPSLVSMSVVVYALACVGRQAGKGYCL